MELRQGDLSVSKLIVLQQRLVNQDVLGLCADKCTFLNKCGHGTNTLLFLKGYKFLSNSPTTCYLCLLLCIWFKFNHLAYAVFTGVLHEQLAF